MEQPQKLPLSAEASEIFEEATRNAIADRAEFLMPEHVLIAALRHDRFADAVTAAGGDPVTAINELLEWLEKETDRNDDTEESISASWQTRMMFRHFADTVAMSSAEEIGVPHIAAAILSLEESMAAAVLSDAVGSDTGTLMEALIEAYTPAFAGQEENEERRGAARPADDWRRMVVCVNDIAATKNPLVGRERELERTIQVLCRKDKNNPLHIGEPGVGKTALVYGLARMIDRGEVPDRLKGSRIYRLDLGQLIAGTQFRGDFEKRIKAIIDGVTAEKGAIVYIDEIHNLVGAGATGESSLDASNILKPYLETGDIRFIGSTTYEEYNRHFAKSKGLVRRFQQIDIAEPTVAEAIEIARQLKPVYEVHHGVSYTDEAITFAVEGTARHISDRCLPDKALDLIDDAGAWREIHPADAPAEEAQTVDRALVEELLAKTCRIEATAMASDERLDTLAERIRSQIYGQDEAVSRVSEAVMMSKAGLTDEGKPLASLLFVGPTGVGKTEVARVLAAEMGLELVRFDMSEYAEKHTVAKLIGSPAGYVGYEDGGLLTDAIRRAPNCVLLLDEIEKAHPDIYNILLQVMDYARLTDNKGRHADFRNVVLIMTSNAGAQYASQARVGFASQVTTSQAMMAQVRKTFRPEFINRLSATVLFNDMDRTMASLILDKKLAQLGQRLAARNVGLAVAEDARERLLKLGFTREYGARELDRVIAAELKPQLMREILFGGLREGGRALATLAADGNTIEIKTPTSEE